MTTVVCILDRCDSPDGKNMDGENRSRISVTLPYCFFHVRFLPFFIGNRNARVISLWLHHNMIELLFPFHSIPFVRWIPWAGCPRVSWEIEKRFSIVRSGFHRCCVNAVGTRLNSRIALVAFVVCDPLIKFERPIEIVLCLVWRELSHDSVKHETHVILLVCGLRS